MDALGKLGRGKLDGLTTLACYCMIILLKLHRNKPREKGRDKGRPSKRSRQEEEVAEEGEDESAAEEQPATQTQGRRPPREREAQLPQPVHKQSQADKAYSEMDHDERRKKVKNLARLLLAHEARRAAMKREDAKAKVLGNNAKAFKSILGKSSELLKDVFGMETVELSTKTKSFTARTAAGENQNDPPSGSSGLYVLRSSLPSGYHELLMPFFQNEGQFLSLVSILLSLIFIQGRSIPEDRLEYHLKDLLLAGRDAPKEDPVFGETSKLINSLVRSGYLDKIKGISVGERDAFEYAWGPRARAEMDENACVEFIQSVMEDNSETLRANILKASGVHG